MIGRAVRGIGTGLGRAAMSKPGTVGIIGGAAALGFASQAAPAARDAAMDVAFGDPNADATFLGRKLTPGALFDTVVPGEGSAGDAVAIGATTTIGGAGIGTLIGKGAFSMRSKSAIKGGLVGGAAGAVVGAGIFAGLTAAYVGRNEKFFRESPYVGERRLNRRDMTYGGSLYDQRGRRNKSRDVAQELNADGNIVLGMFNLRRGG